MFAVYFSDKTTHILHGLVTTSLIAESEFEVEEAWLCPVYHFKLLSPTDVDKCLRDKGDKLWIVPMPILTYKSQQGETGATSFWEAGYWILLSQWLSGPCSRHHHLKLTSHLVFNFPFLGRVIEWIVAWELHLHLNAINPRRQWWMSVCHPRYGPFMWGSSGLHLVASSVQLCIWVYMGPWRGRGFWPSGRKGRLEG